MQIQLCSSGGYTSQKPTDPSVLILGLYIGACVALSMGVLTGSWNLASCLGTAMALCLFVAVSRSTPRP